MTPAGALLAGERALLRRWSEGEPDGDVLLEVRGSFVADRLAQASGGRLAEIGATGLRNLRILDGLDLSGLAAPSASLTLRDCLVEGDVDLKRTRLAALRLQDCHCRSASLDDAAIDDVSLSGVELAGRLDLNGLAANRLSVSGSRLRGVVSLCGARIGRDVVFRTSTVGTGKVALTIEGSVIERGLTFGKGLLAEGRVSVIGGRIERLSILADAQIDGLQLQRVDVGDIVAEAGAAVRDGVSAGGLKVRGDVRLDGAFSTNLQRTVLDLQSADIAGDLILGEGFEGAGALRIKSSRVAGIVRLGGRLRVDGGNALDVSRLVCGRLELTFVTFAGGASLRQSQCSGLTLTWTYDCPADSALHIGLECSGRVVLGAVGGEPTRVAGALSLIGLECSELLVEGLHVAAHDAGRWGGVAIAGRHLAVKTFARIGRPGGGGVFLDGVVAFDHAKVGDDLGLHGVSIVGRCAALGQQGDVLALSLRNATLGGKLEFQDAELSLCDAGTIDLSGMKVQGDLMLTGLRLNLADGRARLNLSGAAVGGSLVAAGLGGEGDWTIDLSDASVGRLEDDDGLAWDALTGVAGPPHLHLAGLRYATFSDGAPGGLSRRLAWLDRNSRRTIADGGVFSPQPYRALIRAMKDAGMEAQTKGVEMVALRQARRLGGGSWPARLGGWLLDLTSGYGHSPARATAVLGVYLLIGWVGVLLADSQGAFESSPLLDGSVLAQTAVSHPNGCPWLDPPLYALDLIIPLTTLGNEALCTVRADHDPWIWAMVIYRLFGWIFMSIALLTYSGILKREA